MVVYGREGKYLINLIYVLQEISNFRKGNLILAKNYLQKSLPLPFLQQLTQEGMEGVCAIHEGCQVVNGHTNPAENCS